MMSGAVRGEDGGLPYGGRGQAALNGNDEEKSRVQRAVLVFLVVNENTRSGTRDVNSRKYTARFCSDGGYHVHTMWLDAQTAVPNARSMYLSCHFEFTNWI